jgi:hypothetical protein
MYHKHEDDFYGWTMQNSSLLKQEKFSEAYRKNIIELKRLFIQNIPGTFDQCLKKFLS